MAYFEDFSRYIASFCKKKLLRRVTQKMSSVLVDRLENMSDETLAAYKDSLPLEKVEITPNDLRFYAALRAVAKSEPTSSPLESKLPYEIHTIAKESKLLETLDAANEAAKAGAGAGAEAKTADIYNEHTFIEFHHLLVAIMAGYRNALGMPQAPEEASADTPSPNPDPQYRTDKKTSQRRAKHKKAMKVAREKAQELAAEAQAANKPSEWEAINHICSYGILLWKISHTSLLRSHLAYLCNVGLVTPSTATLDANKWGHDEDDDTYPLPSEETGPMYVRWFRVLADHFSSLFYLSKFVLNHVQGPVKITLLAARASPKLTVRWDSVLASAFERMGHQLDDPTTQKIKQYICSRATVPTRAGTRKQGEKILTAGGSIFRPSSDNVEVCGTIHCEALLASLVKHPERVRSTPGAWVVRLSVFLL